MITQTPMRLPNRRSRGVPTAHRKPLKDRFAAIRLHLTTTPVVKIPMAPLAVTALLVSGILGGALWPQKGKALRAQDEIFVMEEEVPLPPPELPPPSDPTPLTPMAAKVEPPPPQFGLEDDALSEGGDMAVATGNTIMKAADSLIAPAPPSLPAAPVFIDQAPKILTGDPPEYPARALDRGLEGTVVALIAIDTNGSVTDVKIEKSAGADFDGAVLKAARQTHFQPPVRNGRKVPARFRRPFEFSLE